MVVRAYHDRSNTRDLTQERPGCAKCFYTLGGWSSSICPECGADARLAGVRVGTSTMQSSLQILVIVVALVIVAPALVELAVLVSSVTYGHQQLKFESVKVDRLHVNVDITFMSRTWPPAHEYAGTLSVVRLEPDVRGGRWVNGRWKGPPMPERELAFDLEMPLGEIAIREAIAAIVDAQVYDAEITAVATDYLVLLEDILANQRTTRRPLRRMSIPGVSSSAFEFRGGGGGGSGGRMWAVMWIPVILALIGVIAAGWWGIGRWCRRGWRPLIENEWADVPQR